MYSELECGICYRTYNAGRRCPRELHCKHSFCESCLLVLFRCPGNSGTHLVADRLIVCPLCRQTTCISGERKISAELKLDECVLERLLAAGVLEQEQEQEEEEEVVDGEGEDHREEERGEEVQEGEEAVPPETPAEERDSSAHTRGGKLRRSLRKVWRKISGERAQQRGGEKLMTNADLRTMAMMSCYMF
ncbi:E3 ubiquitin-protein ligase-like isoform X2 [Channa argus]|uniref:E3 ubiquitin-protein ligase-like isoform X2 n=1 Tax=Channa argus TaxID=215402 RepID=UPI0035224029